MDDEAKKAALRKIPYGVFVVGVRQGEELNAFTLDWISQCSFHPPLVMMGVRTNSKSHGMIESDRVFVVNVLGKDQADIAETFFKAAEKAGNTLSGYSYRLGATGAPILEDAIAHFECEVRDIVRGGDHDVIIGQVIDAGVHRDEPVLLLDETGWAYGG